MKIAFRETFYKDLKKITDSRTAQKIKSVILEIENIAHLSEIKNLKKLKGHKNFYRIRVGDFRIGVVYEDNSMKIERVVHRKDIYKKFP